MHSFRWLSPDPLPPACDLRQCGWVLCEDTDALAGRVLLLNDWGARGWAARGSPELTASTLLIGVDDAAERAKLLNLGFGEVLGPHPGLEELAARGERLLAHVKCEPRQRRHDGLVLDLLAREAFSAERAIGLHPREFDLMWRLMSSPGVSISKVQLLRDVWRLNHDPGTNSLAVHASRLRAKLREVGYSNLIETTADGYVYPLCSPAVPLSCTDEVLDGYARLTDGALEEVS